MLGTAGNVASSLGAGLLLFDRSPALPDARRSHDGLDFVGGLPMTSREERDGSREVPAEEVAWWASDVEVLEMVGPSGEGRREAR